MAGCNWGAYKVNFERGGNAGGLEKGKTSHILRYPATPDFFWVMWRGDCTEKGK